MVSSGSLAQRLSTSKKERNCITELQFREAINSTASLLKGLVIHRKSIGCWIIVLVYMKIPVQMNIHGMGNIALTSQNVPELFGNHFHFGTIIVWTIMGVEVHKVFCLFVFVLTKTVDNIKAWPMVGMFSVLPTLCQENPSIIGSFSS